MDGNGNGKIDIQEFVLALAICIRGSSDEKLNCFIFNFFSLFFFLIFLLSHLSNVPGRQQEIDTKSIQ